MSNLQDRASWLPISLKKSILPFTLDPTLTFYCPQENVDAFQHPAIKAFHDYMRRDYWPPQLPGETVLILYPCTKVKPYTLSKEHLEINNFWLKHGFQPSGPGDTPPELLEVLPPGYPADTLNTSPLVGNGLTLQRMVVSEPMGLVPYEHIYYWWGALSPASRYDDPGLFEHRGTAVCLWRADQTAVAQANGKYRWGPAERAAYVEVHNYLSDLIAAILTRLQPYYRRIVGYVSPKLTHRSFLTSNAEKKANGIPTVKQINQGRAPLIGVNQRAPGLVDIVPSAAEFQEIKEQLGRRLAAQGQVSASYVQAYFASGGGGETPLILPEALALLARHVLTIP